MTLGPVRVMGAGVVQEQHVQLVSVPYYCNCFLIQGPCMGVVMNHINVTYSYMITKLVYTKEFMLSSMKAKNLIINLCW